MKLKIFLVLFLILFTLSCSQKQKGYSVTFSDNKSKMDKFYEEKTSQEKNAKGKEKQEESQSSEQGGNASSNPAVIYNDDEFFDFIEKIESGEIVPEPPRNQEIVEPEPLEIPEGDILEIKEDLFITQINDIYFNYERYKEKTIIVEGMFTYFVSYFDDSKFPAVYRLGPGCCGNDGWGGFLLDFTGKAPEENDWVRIVGKPYLKEVDGYEDLYLKVVSMEVKQERGKEFVLR